MFLLCKSKSQKYFLPFDTSRQTLDLWYGGWGEIIHVFPTPGPRGPGFNPRPPQSKMLKAGSILQKKDRPLQTKGFYFIFIFTVVSV